MKIKDLISKLKELNENADIILDNIEDDVEVSICWTSDDSSSFEDSKKKAKKVSIEFYKNNDGELTNEKN